MHWLIGLQIDLVYRNEQLHLQMSRHLDTHTGLIANWCFQMFTTGNVVQMVLLSQYILTTLSCPNPHPSKCGEQKLQTDSLQVCLCIQSQNSSTQQTAIWTGAKKKLSERATSGFMIIKLVQLSIFGNFDPNNCSAYVRERECAVHYLSLLAKFFSLSPQFNRTAKLC